MEIVGRVCGCHCLFPLLSWLGLGRVESVGGLKKGVENKKGRVSRRDFISSKALSLFTSPSDFCHHLCTCAVSVESSIWGKALPVHLHANKETIGRLGIPANSFRMGNGSLQVVYFNSRELRLCYRKFACTQTLCA